MHAVSPGYYIDAPFSQHCCLSTPTLTASHSHIQVHSEKVDPQKQTKNVENCKPQDDDDRSCKVNHLGEARGESVDGDSDGSLTLIGSCVEHADAFLETDEEGSENDGDETAMRTVMLSDMSHIPTPSAVAKRRQATRLKYPQRYQLITGPEHVSMLHDLLTNADPRDHVTFQKMGRLVQNRPVLLSTILGMARDLTTDIKIFERLVSVLAGIGHDDAQHGLLSLLRDTNLSQHQRHTVVNSLGFVRGPPTEAVVDAMEHLTFDHYPRPTNNGRDPVSWVAPTTLGTLVSRLKDLEGEEAARGQALQDRLERHAHQALDGNHVAERQVTWLNALKNTNAESILPVIERYLLGDSAVSEEKVRLAAVRALSHVPTEDAERLLLVGLADDSASVRAHAVSPFAAGHRQSSPTAHAVLLAARDTETHHEVTVLLEAYASSGTTAAVEEEIEVTNGGGSSQDQPEARWARSRQRRTLLAAKKEGWAIPYTKELKKQFGSDATYIKFYLMAQLQFGFPQAKAEAGIALHTMGRDITIFAIGVQFNRFCVTEKGRQKTRLMLLPYVMVFVKLIPLIPSGMPIVGKAVSVD